MEERDDPKLSLMDPLALELKPVQTTMGLGPFRDELGRKAY